MLSKTTENSEADLLSAYQAVHQPTTSSQVYSEPPKGKSTPSTKRNNFDKNQPFMQILEPP